jgi:hypothetical protein
MKKLQTFIYKDQQLNTLNEYINAPVINTCDFFNICGSVIFVSYEFFQTSALINNILQNNNTLILASDCDAVLLMLNTTPDNVFQLIDGELLIDKKNTFTMCNEWMSLLDTIEAGKVINVHNRDQSFFTLIGRHDDHRDALVNALYQQNLMQQGLVIYHDHRNLDNVVTKLLANQHPEDKFVKDFNNCKLERVWHDGHPNKNYYETYNLEIVTETTVNAHFLTEKTMKPLVSKMPFLTVSSPGYLKYLRNLGYKTFGDIFDESYDNITDTTHRARAIVDTLNTLISTKQIYNLTNTCSDILKHNVLHAREIELKHFDNKRNIIEQILNNITKY